jgi:PAS domain S-box-containing protein
MVVNQAGQKPSRQLLLVDDEESILQSLRRMLRRDGYVIHLATSGEAGLAVLEEHAIGVIVTDQRMPGMSGSDFLSIVKERQPDTVRIVLSGYTELNSIADAINKGAIYKFLTKPWDDELLRQHIAEAFSRSEMKGENERLGIMNQAMLNAIPDALFLVEPASRLIVSTNAAAARLLGCEAAELTGKSIADIEPLPLDQCYWEEVSTGPFRPLSGVDTEYQRKDGEFIPIRKATSLAAVAPAKTVLVLAHDLTRERRIESSLERLNAEMASVFEATSEGLLVLDDGHRLVRINRRFNEIWGIPETLLLSRDGDEILRAMAGQSKTPEETASELLSHFVSPESRSSGYFERSSGDTIRWFGNPQILNDDVIGHVFGFSAIAAPEIWKS